jgi:hypothetical protein
MSEQTPETILRVEDAEGNSADIRAKHLGEWQAKGYFIPSQKPPADTTDTTDTANSGNTADTTDTGEKPGEQPKAEESQNDGNGTDLD